MCQNWRRNTVETQLSKPRLLLTPIFSLKVGKLGLVSREVSNLMLRLLAAVRPLTGKNWEISLIRQVNHKIIALLPQDFLTVKFNQNSTSRRHTPRQWIELKLRQGRTHVLLLVNKVLAETTSEIYLKSWDFSFNLKFVVGLWQKWDKMHKTYQNKKPMPILNF